MGIQGLLNLLNPIIIKEHISSFQGKTAAIDILSWIYKGCSRCAFEHNQNIESNTFLYYILQMLDLLWHYHITPICVFDGKYISRKDNTIAKRKKDKEENRQKGLEYLEQGNEAEARKYLSRCIIIDERIITLTIKALHTKGVEYMVAPYESDSQIAKLVHLGIADFAITEDSDLIVYNVKVVLKLSQDGQCDFIDVAKWKPEDVDPTYLKLYLKMQQITRVQSAVLAGSDYNRSIRGIGIKRAVKHLAERKTMNSVIEHLRNKKPYCDNIPENYESIVLDSKLIFNFATVYNPFTRQLEFLNENLLDQLKPPEMQFDELKKIVGPFYEYNQDIKMGRVNPRSLEPRVIDKIDIKNVFSINANNLTIREQYNRKRRELYNEQQKRREEERRLRADNGQQDIVIENRPKKKKVVEPAVELTEEEKKRLSEQRKAARLKRFSDFKNMLNQLVMEYSSESQSISDSSSEEPIQKMGTCKKNSKKQDQIQKIPSNKKSNNTKDDQKQDEESNSECSESIDLGLQSLNPWMKHN